MIITRDLINKNIVYQDYRNRVKIDYTYNSLDRLINAYKNLLISKSAKKGRSVVIGNQASMSQIAMVFACAELGLNIIIVATPFPPNKSAKDYVPGVINSKLRQMMPIDYFLVNDRNQTDKFQVFNDICRITIVVEEENLDYTPNDTVWADEDTVLIKCTSSGTTDTPKVILHTHGFMSELVLRNSTQFYGVMGMMNNLAHGSSPAVYFLPGLMCKDVTKYINMPVNPMKVAMFLKETNVDLDHLLVPYTALIDDFLTDSDFAIPGCVIHTLGMIRNQWVTAMKQGKIKDIVSIFGTNETSGPFMLNKASDVDFTEDTYFVADDFYKVELNSNNELEVTMPIYNTVLKTNDRFLKRGNKFVHLGRSNLYRINDLEIDVSKYQLEIDKLMKAELVIDSKKDSIYLAVWENVDDKNINYINDLMRKDSEGLHFISKHAMLNYSDYLNGVKVDKEMLREFFRNQ